MLGLFFEIRLTTHVCKTGLIAFACLETKDKQNSQYVSKDSRGKSHRNLSKITHHNAWWFSNDKNGIQSRNARYHLCLFCVVFLFFYSDNDKQKQIKKNKMQKNFTLPQIRVYKPQTYQFQLKVFEYSLGCSFFYFCFFCCVFPKYYFGKTAQKKLLTVCKETWM